MKDESVRKLIRLNANLLGSQRPMELEDFFGQAELDSDDFEKFLGSIPGERRKVIERFLLNNPEQIVGRGPQWWEEFSKRLDR